VISVVLVDDQAMVREGFGAVLAAQEGIEVVAGAADGEEAVVLTRQHRPDVVLMDIRMPKLDGLAATRTLLEVPPDAYRPRVLVLTTFDLDEYVFEALRAGASGFLLKDATAADLVTAVRVIAAGWRIFTKLDLRDRAQAVVFAYESGLVTAGR
jgi:DNA-binding NarL/FixJ family response regulator